MGREIRRVPKGWEHPKDTDGNYIPLYNETYAEALAGWQEEKEKWDNKECDHATAETYEKYTFEEWHGSAPDPDYCRPEFGEVATCYQIYQTVSEGTPASPVFDTLEEMEKWLLGQGYSEKAASQFTKTGWAPSMVVIPGRGVSGIGIHSLDWL